MPLPAKKEIDVSRTFLAYLSFNGDAARTAMACDLDIPAVQALADREQWPAKINHFSALKEKDANFQITINRVVNYCQARQLSSLVDAVIAHMAGQDIGELLTTTTKNGSSFDTKPLADLVKAAEAIHRMTCAALGDTGGIASSDDKATGGSIGLNVIKALNEVANNKGLSAVQIVKDSLAPKAYHDL